MATQLNTRNVATDDPYANGPPMSALKIAGTTPFSCPETETQLILGEVYGLLAFMSASYDTSHDAAMKGNRDTELVLLNDSLRARAFDGVQRLVSLSLHLIDVADAARSKEATT